MNHDPAGSMPAEPHQSEQPPAILVLLVEDNPGDARLVRELLADAGDGRFAVTHVSTLGEACRAMGLARYDVALLDLTLPDTQGLETFRQFHAAYPTCPTIILSGLVNETVACQAVEQGAQDFVPKGMDHADLLVRSIRYAMTRAGLDAQLVRTIQELEHSNGQLTVAREMALESARMKSEFLATISHEIRTPMNGVLGAIGLLFDTPLTAEQREYVDVARNSGEHLLTILNDILDFSTIDAGKLRMERLDFNLRHVVQDAVDPLVSPASDKGIQLASLFHANVPTALQGDPGRLRQIVVNLVGNAIKFTERGEVLVRVAAVEETAEEAVLRLDVIDTGIGIAPEQQMRLFQPFVQADGSTTREYGGTGLGLSIAARLVEAMGGQIGVDSEPGNGSRFWFTARLAKQQGAPPRDTGQSTDLHGLHVCLVNRAGAPRQAIECSLADWGLLCDSEEQAVAALVRLRNAAAAEAPYDVVIFSDQSAGMEWSDFARTITDDLALQATPLVLLTSLGRRGDAQKAGAAGIAAYLPQPIHQSELFDCLATVMTRRAATHEDPMASEALDRVQLPLVTRHSLAEKRRNAKPRILVAENNVINQKVAVTMLERLGYSADVVVDGLEAIEALTRIAYAAVFMDCRMTEMDGFEATRAIREREASGNVSSSRFQVSGSGPENSGSQHETRNLKPETPSRLPIIAMTANAMPGDRELCLAAGMDDYITKPITYDTIRLTLARWIPSHRPHDAHRPSSPVERPKAA